MNKTKNIKLPQSQITEQSVIAALIIDFENCSQAMEILSEDCFYSPFYRKVFETVKELLHDSQSIDLITIGSKIGADSMPKLIEATQTVASALNVVQHSQFLYELYARRKLIQISAELQSRAFDITVSIDEAINHAQNGIKSLFDFDSAKTTAINDTLEDVFVVINRNKNTEHGLTGIGTGLTELDKFSGGLQPTDLVVIAGETSQGKTSLALTIAKNAAMQYGAKVVFYSLEMSNIQLTARLISQETAINSKRILSYPLDDETVRHISDNTWNLANAKIYFDSSSSTNISSILRSIRSLKQRYDIDVVVVDYLGLISSSERDQNREQQMGGYARSLKNIAKELNICVIVLSQLRRADNPEPTINRLRDSGQIEEAADMIIFTYRPEVYNRDYPHEFKNYNTEATAMINVAKGRNTGTTRFIVSFEKEITLYKDYDSGYVPHKPLPF
jgi:replicative DNA helicase